MALQFQSNDPIRTALCEELLNLLSPVTHIRQSAEEHMKQLEITEGYGVFLAEIIMNQSFDIALRQLASVMLKKYVEVHWNDIDNDVTVIATDLAKKMIRNILPNGLYDENSKIRISVAYTISIIASLDWPNTWTELFDIIVKCLGGNENSIHGAMHVLTEFTNDITVEITVVGPIILAEVYRIFEADTIYNVKTRTCAMQIFRSLFKSITAVIDNKHEQTKMLEPVLPGLIEKMMQILSNQNRSVSNFALKKEIIKTLGFMVNEMPKHIRPYTVQIMPSIWQLLTQTADIYVQAVVCNGAAITSPLKSNSAASPVDDDDEDDLFTFISMVLEIIEFIHSIVDQTKFKNAIKNVLSDLIYIMIVYMQITEEQIDTWSDDSEKFIEEDYQDDVDGSVRNSAHEVLDSLGHKFGDEIFAPLTEALARHVNVAQAEQQAGKQHWWKIHEACMVAVGFFRNLILETPRKFDIGQYLNYTEAIMSNHRNTINGDSNNSTGSSYLLARCIWLLSRFASQGELYTVQRLSIILDTTLNCLQSDKPITLRIYAIRSLYELCESLKQCTDERHALIAAKLPEFLDGIIGFIPVVKNSVMSLLLETLTIMTSYDINFAATNHNKIIPLTIAIFLKHRDDPFLLADVQELLKILSQNPFCLQPLQEKIVPTLVSILNVQNSAPSMHEIALDVLHTIVKYSKAPLSEQLIEIAFPAAVHCILRTDDNSVMQSGGECLRAFIFVSPEQVCSYKNGQGLNSIIEITTMLLNPMNTEFSASFAGHLVITIITKAGNMLGENIYLLLKAVISKMQLVESLNVAMSLVMTFAHLFVTQMEAVLNFLSTVPGPTGEPAIHFVFSNWLCRQELFYGAYERKVSTMALCKLFEYGVTTKDSRLTSVTVRELVDSTDALASIINYRRGLRSQTSQNPQEWRSIPVLVKIFKLLINELANLKETADEGDCDSNSDDDDPEDTEHSSLTKLPSYMFEDDYEEDNCSQQLLEELLQDPIFQISMEENLTKFLQNFSRDDHFREFTEHLTSHEKLILQGIRVSA